ncbi:MAG: TRAP-type transport system small permease protein [Thermoanaerobacteraceae bacterium]|jgi:TRAP-type C4-dicarboxylate transport system permease small subunit|nr:TRAP-type transport system small permease protein [Thermoanaerobacteraceae bacterium]
MLRKILHDIVKILGNIFLIALVVCVLLQVFFRYVLKISVPWTEEMARVFVIWLTIIGLAVIESENTQITTTYFVSKLKIPYQKIWKTVITLISILFLIAFFVGSLNMIPKTGNIMWGSIPWIKTNIVYIPPIIAVPLAIIFILYQYKDFKKFDEM